jgi:ATP-dependent exoDNAse (exonuclease V) alpha subunit
MTNWSPQQDGALKAVADWLGEVGVTRRLSGKRPAKQVFRLFGFAGTGKTTLVRHLAEDIEGDVAFAAYTGKAALVMREKGCADASTIHSLIYRPRQPTKEAEDEEPAFVINRQSAASEAKLIVIDECSMVDADLGKDLLSFGVPVLVLGDPAQLPPVKGGGYFTEAEPDVMLTEVHRQARDNPIVEMASIVREGGRLTRGTYGDSRVIGRRDIDATQVLAAGQVLVGMNRSRRAYNARIRELMGFTTPTPSPGDKVVCLRNDKAKGLFNGGLWLVKEVGVSKRGLVTMRLASEEAPDGKTVKVTVPPALFGGDDDQVAAAMALRTEAFDYGYALTVHKAQGSQWDAVVLFDESFAFKEHRARWLYTGLTRAAHRITVVD